MYFPIRDRVSRLETVEFPASILGSVGSGGGAFLSGYWGADMDSRVLVLLVASDDEFLTMDDLISESEAAEFELACASMYDAALEQIRRYEHDVYVLSYRLGERNGLDLLREAKGRGWKSPVILLAGKEDPVIDLDERR